MEEENTTVQEVVDTGADNALPEVQDSPQPAVEDDQADSSEQQPDEQAQPVVSEVDDKLKNYAASQGIDLDSPSSIKAAKIAMSNQSEATKNYQKSRELEKATNIDNQQLPSDASQQDYDNVRLRNLEMQVAVQNWKSSNPEKIALENQMIEVLSDPNKKQLVQQGYLSLDDVYSLAKANAPDNSVDVKSQGKREALESLAHKQQAAVPRGNATTPGASSGEKPFESLSLSEMEAKLGVVRR